MFREESVQRETGAAELISICDNADMGRKTDTRACTDRPLSAHSHRHAGRQTRAYTRERTHTYTHHTGTQTVLIVHITTYSTANHKLTPFAAVLYTYSRPCKSTPYYCIFTFRQTSFITPAFKMGLDVYLM